MENIIYSCDVYRKISPLIWEGKRHHFLVTSGTTFDDVQSLSITTYTCHVGQRLKRRFEVFLYQNQWKLILEKIYIETEY